MNSCLLSVIGAVLVVATIYDMLTNGSLRRLVCYKYNGTVNSEMTEDGAVNDDSLITDHQTPVLDTADDRPLILTSHSTAPGASVFALSCFCVNLCIHADL